MTAELIQGTPEWLAFRKNKIGASDAPSIMGIGFSTPFALWEEKLGLRPAKFENWAMARGKELEVEARACFELMTGFTVAPHVATHTTYEWMIASLDGMSLDREIIVEIKCPGRIDHQMARDGNIPDKYYPQLQHQMEVCDVNSMYYFSYDGTEGIVLECKRDDVYIQRLLKAEKEFWRCLQELDSPKLTVRDFLLKEDNEWVKETDNWRHWKGILDEAEENLKQSRDTLIRMSNNANCRGNGVKIQRKVSQGRINYKAIPELKSIDLDEYRSDPIESFTIMEE